MDYVIVLSSLAAAVYSIIKICSKRQGFPLKLLKSVGALWYFLTSSGLFLTDGSEVIGIAMLIAGFVFAWYFNRGAVISKPEIISRIVTDPEKGSNVQSDYQEPIFENQIDIAKHRHLLKIGFSYEDTNGRITHREVDIKKFDGLCIEGYCHSRKQLRTFRIDRVIDGITMRDTGEFFSTEEWSEQFYLTV